MAPPVIQSATTKQWKKKKTKQKKKQAKNMADVCHDLICLISSPAFQRISFLDIIKKQNIWI